MLQVDRQRIIVITQHRANLASLVPIRIEHEVIDNQLGILSEEVAQRLLPSRPLKGVGLIDLLPRQVATQLGKFVPQLRSRFFFFQKLEPRLKPLFAGNYRVVGHDWFSEMKGVVGGGKWLAGGGPELIRLIRSPSHLSRIALRPSPFAPQHPTPAWFLASCE